MTAPTPEQLQDLSLDLQVELQKVELQKLEHLVEGLASLSNGIVRFLAQISRVLHGGTPEVSEWRLRLLALPAAAGLLMANPVAAQPAPFQQPVRVRLQWVPEPTNPTIKKLGLYAAINGGQPVLFEFDTGGGGFNATYAAPPALASPWWGSAPDCSSFSCTPFPKPITYDSGLTYNGSVVTGSVQLFDAPGTVKLSVNNVTLGQTTSISCTGTSTNASPTCLKKGDSGWGNTDPAANFNPPVEGRFYGDFGMSIKAGSSGINSLVTQAEFWNLFHTSVVTPGFRVHASDDDPWVQFGLSLEDRSPRHRSFALNTATGGINDGSLRVEDGRRSFSGVGLTSLIFDTGATTTIHSGTVTLSGAPFPPGAFPCELTALGCPADANTNASPVVSGARVVVGGLSVIPGVGEVDILDILAGSDDSTGRFFNQVGVQGLSTDPLANLAPACESLNAPCYYLNTGILPFLEHDIVVNLDPTLSNPQLTLIRRAAAVPGTAPLLGALSAFRWSRRLRRRSRGGAQHRPGAARAR